MPFAFIAAALAGSFAHAVSIDLECSDRHSGIRVRGRFEKSDGFYLPTEEFHVFAPGRRKTFPARAVGLQSDGDGFKLDARLDDGSSLEIAYPEAAEHGGRMEVVLRKIPGGELRHDTEEADCDFAPHAEK